MPVRTGRSVSVAGEEKREAIAQLISSAGVREARGGVEGGVKVPETKKAAQR